MNHQLKGVCYSLSEQPRRGEPRIPLILFQLPQLFIIHLRTRLPIVRNALECAISGHLVLELADLRHDLVAIPDSLFDEGLLLLIFQGLGFKDKKMTRVVKLIDDTRDDNGPSADDCVVTRVEFSR